MSAETKKVDVLDVMNMAIAKARDIAAANPRRTGLQQDVADAERARAAVAELIEAAKNASAVLSHSYHTQIKGDLANDAHDAYQRLDACLESIIGSAA